MKNRGATQTWRYFLRRFPGDGWRQSVERAALEQRRLLAEPGLVPVALERLAHLLSIEVRDVTSSFRCREGSLSPAPRGFICELRQGVSPTRRRFSLAHEIGHSLFYDCTHTPPRHVIGSLVDEELEAEESLCNAFASALLLPENSLRESIASQVVRANPRSFLQHVEHIALRRYQVSLVTLVARLHTIHACLPGFRIVVFAWKADPPRELTPRLRVAAWADLSRSFNARVWTNRSPEGVGLHSVRKLFDDWSAAKASHAGAATRGWRFPLEEPPEVDECIHASHQDAIGKWSRISLSVRATSRLYARGDCGDGNVYIVTVLFSPESTHRPMLSPVAKGVSVYNPA